MKRLTQQDMTESEQRELKTLLDRARKAQGRELTNSENNRIKDDYIDTLMAEKEKSLRKRGPKSAVIKPFQALLQHTTGQPALIRVVVVKR